MSQNIHIGVHLHATDSRARVLPIILFRLFHNGKLSNSWIFTQRQTHAHVSYSISDHVAEYRDVKLCSKEENGYLFPHSRIPTVGQTKG